MTMPHDLAPELQAPPSYTVEGRLGQRWWTWQRFAEHDDAARAIAQLIEARRFDAIRLLETRHRTGKPPEVLRELFHYDPAPATIAVPPVAAPVQATQPAPVHPPATKPASVQPTPPAVPPAPAPAALQAAPVAAIAATKVAAPAQQGPLIGAPAARAVADAFARMEAEFSAQARREQDRREEAQRDAAAAPAPDLPTTADIWPALWQATVPVVSVAKPPAALPVAIKAPIPRDAFDDTEGDDYAPLVAMEETSLPPPLPPAPSPSAPKPPTTWDPAEIDAAMAALRAALREVEAIAPAVAARAATQPEPLARVPAVEEPVFTASDRPSVAPANDDARRAAAATQEAESARHAATDGAVADDAVADDDWDAVEAPRVARQGQWRFRLRRVGYSLGTTAAAVLLAIAGYETTRLAIGLPDLLGEARHIAGGLIAGPERPIVAAARRGDGAEVERLLKGGFSADSDDPQGVPVLLVAARAGHADIVRALLDAGGDPNRRFGQADTPILAATREGLLPAVDAMLTRGGQVNGRGGADDCETPLLVAAAAGRLDMVTFLLGRGATFDVLPGCRRGPLDAAAPHPRVRDALETAYQRRLAGVPRGSPAIAPAVATGADLAPPPRAAALALAPPPLPVSPPPAAKPAVAEPAVEPRGYGVLMYGFTWRETLAEVKAKAKECRALGRRYEVCTLAVKPMFDDAAAVEAWFDRADGDRFVSIETRSIDLIDYTAQRDGAAVRRRFDEVRREIERFLPAGSRPVVQRTAPPGSMTFFEGLKPDVAQGDYSAFWSDDSRRRPASIQLKLGGIDNRKGFYRVVVSNPLRQTQQAAIPTR